MANRRMFSLDVVDTDKFLEMPTSTQALYFHLGMRADDDGFVSSPRRIVALVGAGDDDLKLLFAKGFVIPFQDGVCVITDWKLNNYIQSDRYRKTRYSEHLEQLKSNKNGSYQLLYTDCIQNGYNSYTQDRLGKDSIGKVNINTYMSENPDEESHKFESSKINYQNIVEKFNSICVDLPKVTKLSDSRKAKIKTFLKEFTLDDLYSVFEKAHKSDFLSGRNNKWSASFDWLINKANAVKVLDGNYNNKNQSTPAEIKLPPHYSFGEKGVTAYE